eukprot:TRINITY_DN4489_c0_g1_i3.p1 TRINITY_DN4489_c0_g1~~TRINITY_DN4489_c0_g1_i3.p1  ORF type:complete len:210 (-),score=22.39 TRINITY_DN4489_c0_g1_i3:836-1465(-)
MSTIGGRSKPRIKLANNPTERKLYDNLANLYSIISTTEALEQLYSYHAIPVNDYQRECALLIQHFKIAKQSTGKEHPSDVKQFMDEYGLNTCRAAYRTLVEVGKPQSHIATGEITAKVVAETVQHFITLKDSLSINMVAVDQIQPLLSDLVDSAKRSLVQFQGLDILENWLLELNKMRAADELPDDKIRQFSHELSVTYDNFHKALSGN